MSKHFVVQEGVSTHPAVIRGKLCCLLSGPGFGSPGSLFRLLISVLNMLPSAGLGDVEQAEALD